jgi:hypothetical protein
MSKMARPSQHYISYLLRLWQARDDGETIWRASLESAHSSQSWGFTSLAALYSFLDKLTRGGDEGEVQGLSDNKE